MVQNMGLSVSPLCPGLAMSVTEEQVAVPLLQWGPKIGQGAGLGHWGMRWVPWGWRPCGLSPTQGKGEEAEEILRWDPETERTRKLDTIFLWMRSKRKTTWCLQILQHFAHLSGGETYCVSCLILPYNLSNHRHWSDVSLGAVLPRHTLRGAFSAYLSLTWHSCATANPALDQLQLGFPGAGLGCQFV